MHQHWIQSFLSSSSFPSFSINFVCLIIDILVGVKWHLIVLWGSIFSQLIMSNTSQYICWSFVFLDLKSVYSDHLLIFNLVIWLFVAKVLGLFRDRFWKYQWEFMKYMKNWNKSDGYQYRGDTYATWYQWILLFNSKTAEALIAPKWHFKRWYWI